MWIQHRGSPVSVMMLALVIGLAVAAAATALALRLPVPGIELTPADDGGVVLPPGSPLAAQAFPEGPRLPVRVLGLSGADGTVVPLSAVDLAPEPTDVIPTYDELAEFFLKQSALTRILGAGRVALHLRDGAGRDAAAAVPVAPYRPITALPAVFWFQVAVGVLGWLLSCWVWALRRGDWGTRLFALVGFAMLGFTIPAAVYSTRPLALDGAMFRVLSDANAAGATLFGAAMIGVFLSYPRRLVPPVVLLAPMVVFGLWLGAHLLRLPEGSGMGAHLPTLLEMIGIVAAIGWQWWATRRDPVGRAALRWLGLSVIIGAGAFVTLMSIPALLRIEAPLSQGYAFGFFLLIHAGLALGLRRYRLFELGDWAFRVMLATLGLFALLMLDAALILTLNLDHNLTLSLSLLAIGFLYLPMRDVLLRRMVSRRTIPDHELFGLVVDVAFVAAPEARADAWRCLLQRLFDPLELAAARDAPARPAVDPDGVMMTVPATAGSGALVLRFPWRGRGLFTPAQLAMATRLCELMAQAESGRAAYARGVDTERRRIARDLHDDLGSRLLSALRVPDLATTRITVREAMADLRTIVSGLTGDRLPLGQVLGDLRHETAQRLEGTGIALDWPVAAEPAAHESVMVDYPVYRAVTAIVREAANNAIRHSGATRLTVKPADGEGSFSLAIMDDGRGVSAQPARAGHGLGNMGRRAEEAGGRLEFPPTGTGTRLDLIIPLQGALAPAPATRREEVPA